VAKVTNRPNGQNFVDLVIIPIFKKPDDLRTYIFCLPFACLSNFFKLMETQYFSVGLFAIE
jgi:hypothetical protein